MENITQFTRSPSFEEAFAPCAETYGSGDAEVYEWPCNVLSPRMAVLESGRICRKGETVVHDVEPDELARCKTLAEKLSQHMSGVLLLSETGAPWISYFRVADSGGEPPSEVDDLFIRALFGGTICPLDAIVVEPVQDSGRLWKQIAGSEDILLEEGTDVEIQAFKERVVRWRELIRHVQSELLTPRIALIGFAGFEPSTEIKDKPAGFEMPGCVLPRMIFGFTPKGSLVGLVSLVVWT